ncbi:NUDIX hydrolase [Streptomyces sp. NPDC012486]|uniref:NUDIX hydrolase n=1 Tax=Streptomyces sp. NPDC012486 TaxID=3156669 RepID=UPI0033CFDE7E
MPAAQYAASRHAVWLGAAAIITDEVGRVLLVHPTYREDDSWLLPGGVVESGEHPHVTCWREITEELGLDLPLSAVVAVHSFSAHHPALQPGTIYPGEVRFVFDGGRLSADQLGRIRLDPAEHDMWAVHDLATWQELMAPRAFARLDAIERARQGAAPPT